MKIVRKVFFKNCLRIVWAKLSWIYVDEHVLHIFGCFCVFAGAFLLFMTWLVFMVFVGFMRFYDVFAVTFSIFLVLFAEISITKRFKKLSTMRLFKVFSVFLCSFVWKSAARWRLRASAPDLFLDLERSELLCLPYSAGLQGNMLSVCKIYGKLCKSNEKYWERK